MNLLEGTILVLQEYGKTPGDVSWVGSADGEFVISWYGFSKISDVEYDNGYGAQEIASDLVVVGRSWWLSREEYDGSEGWQYNTLPIITLNYSAFHRVVVTSTEVGWRTLKELV